MPNLELKIPPVLQLIIFTLLMWFVSLNLPGFSLAQEYQFSTIAALILIAAFVAISGIVCFKNARTTANPFRLDLSTALVTSGIYTKTRNPMYVGLLCLLIAWGVFLSNLYSLALTLGFVICMNRFQIQQEEKALASIFGEDYLRYKNNVRRWW